MPGSFLTPHGMGEAQNVEKQLSSNQVIPDCVSHKVGVALGT